MLLVPSSWLSSSFLAFQASLMSAWCVLPPSRCPLLPWDVSPCVLSSHHIITSVGSPGGERWLPCQIHRTDFCSPLCFSATVNTAGPILLKTCLPEFLSIVHNLDSFFFFCPTWQPSVFIFCVIFSLLTNYRFSLGLSLPSAFHLQPVSLNTNF